MIFVTQKKSVYVDSVAGSDANDGLTQATPKATCAAGMAVLASSGRKTIRLKCGSFFREQITLPAGKRIKNYGSGARPILDPRENITGEWSLYGAAYTYAQVVPHALSSPSVHRVWEDGVRLKRVANAATCETTPGSFYAATPIGTIGTLYIHPTGDGNPNSNGKTYSYSYRMYGVDMRDGSLFDGITTGWNGGNDGSIRALARNVVIRNCDALDGTKHHVLLAEGLVENVNAYDAEPLPGTGQAIAFVMYNNFTTKSVGCTFRKCSVDYVTFTANSAIGFYGHGGVGVDKVVFEDCVVKNCYVAFGQPMSGPEPIIISRCVSVGCTYFAKAEGTPVSNWYIYRSRCVPGAANRTTYLFDGLANSMSMRHCEASSYTGAIPIRVAVADKSYDVRYSQFVPASGGAGGAMSIGYDSIINVENCIGYVTGNTFFFRDSNLLPDYTGGNNLYYSAGSSGARFSTGSDSSLWSVAQWKANLNQDAATVNAAPAITSYATETAWTQFDPAGPVFTSGFPVGVQPTDDAETLALLASVGYTP